MCSYVHICDPWLSCSHLCITQPESEVKGHWENQGVSLECATAVSCFWKAELTWYMCNPAQKCELLVLFLFIICLTHSVLQHVNVYLAHIALCCVYVKTNFKNLLVKTRRDDYSFLKS